MESGCIIDISSSAAYYIPASMIPEETFKLSRSDKEEFYTKMMALIEAVDEFKRQGMAYSLSRNFVQWYVKDCAFIFAQKGIRVLSVSPGLIDTDMSRQDMDKSGNGDVTLSYTGMGRTGVVDEIAFLFSTLVDERNSYLTGIDILCDGGCYATGFRGQRVAKS